MRAVAWLAGCVTLTLTLACDTAQRGPVPNAAQAGAITAVERPAVAAELTPTASATPPVGTPPVSTPPVSTPPTTVAYQREDWPHWIDADRDCQTARTEVLIAESFAPVDYDDARRCEVATGRWQCPYTGDVLDEAHLLDVDHLVPLANAHRSGGAAWTREQRRAYANDLDHPEHLVAVSYKANRSKGDKGPEAWLPPLEDARCGYVKDWDAIKRRWGLSMTAEEAQAVREALAICASGGVPALPQGQRGAEREVDSGGSGSGSGSGECCRVCKKGKACGDGCIAKTSQCSKPAGCACDG